MNETVAKAPRVSLEAKVAFLHRPESYPEMPTRVEARETHMSWVFLTDEFAFKLKKPVRYDFLDFSTIEARRHFCEEEVRLNKELAQGIYVAVVPLVVGASNDLQLGKPGTVVDWLVKSRRLPENRTLDRAVRSGTLSDEVIDAVALALAQFYKSATPIRLPPLAYRRRFDSDLHAIRRELVKPEYGFSLETAVKPVDGLLGVLDALGPLLEERVQKGRIIEGHGDLRPEHIYLTPEPVVMDRLEFNRDFRILDPVDELSYLAMECDLLHASWVGERVLAVYSRVTPDDASPELVRFYKGYRACLRAKISAKHVKEPGDAGPLAWIERSKQYLRLAGRYVG